MKVVFVTLLLMVAKVAAGQNDLPLTFKGTCGGLQTDVHDSSAIQNTPAVRCDSLLVMQTHGQTVLSFSNGRPENPVLMFSGDLFTVSKNQPFDPYLGPIGSAFAIDHVLWGGGTPVVSVRPGEHAENPAGRGCYFHFTGQGWNQLSMVECELVMSTHDQRSQHVAVTFRTGRHFTVDGQQITVEYGARGAQSFYTVFNQSKIDGSCGVGLYQVDGVLKHFESGTPIAHLFQVVCYKDVSQAGQR